MNLLTEIPKTFMQGSRRFKAEPFERALHSTTLDDGVSYNGHLQKATNELAAEISTAYVRYDAKRDNSK